MTFRVRKKRKSPRGLMPYALGAAAVAALLASTACESNAPHRSDDPAPWAAPSMTGWVKPRETDSTQPDETASVKPAETAPAKPGGGKGNSRNGGRNFAAPCAADALSVTAVKEPADSREARHLLITVQNVGDAKCSLYHYPHVRLGADAQTTVPVIKDSAPDPGMPVAIAPGEEAHTALLVSGGAREEYKAQAITLTLHGRELGSNASNPIDVPMPVDMLYADDGQLLTYWTPASGAALDFIMSK
ncbi:DUF4232 domain-containing protein [Streptomyces sp. NPDC127084]|uniref:DUF4232 domain-containing protein n=1 Tax=Streptomyces sp. NPDC127084 TaxID=3347133 RepID=UPI00364C14CA